MATTISIEDVKKARELIRNKVKFTPLELSRSCSEKVGAKTFLKFENLQLTGSFKIRGAMNKIYSLSQEEKSRGIITSSAGNHAQGVAFSASALGVPVKIVMPVTAPLVKVSATKGYGAEIVQEGEYLDQSYSYAKELARDRGYTFVHPYEDPYVMAGQGTIGLEIIESMPEVDTILVPVGGGGLISGIATAVKALKPNVRIYGIQSEAAPALTESFKQKTLTKVTRKTSTIADGVVVKTPSPLVFDNYLTRLIDDMFVVSEDEIADAIVFLMERTKSVVEGAGALSLAAASSRRLKLGANVCCVLSGGNIDLNIVSKVIERGLKKNGRMAKIELAIEDKPGGLSRITQIIAQSRANILQVFHDRETEGLFLGETSIEIILETSGWEQLKDIKEKIVQAGARLIN